MFSWEFCEISKNTFSYRTPPMAASVSHHAKEILYVNEFKLYGKPSWNKSKHFHLFLILMLKKSGFFNVKFFLWIIFKNTFVTEPLQWLLLYLRWLLLYFFKKLIEQLFRNLVMTLWRYDIVTLWRYDIFFFSTHYLMYKKSNSFVYKFVVSCQVFETTPSGCTL